MSHEEPDPANQQLRPLQSNQHADGSTASRVNGTETSKKKFLKPNALIIQQRDPSIVSIG